VFKCNIASAKGLRQYDKRRKMIDSIHRKEGKIQ
jgi:tmRNA-binding protein